MNGDPEQNAHWLSSHGAKTDELANEVAARVGFLSRAFSESLQAKELELKELTDDLADAKKKLSNMTSMRDHWFNQCKALQHAAEKTAAPIDPRPAPITEEAPAWPAWLPHDAVPDPPGEGITADWLRERFLKAR